VPRQNVSSLDRLRSLPALFRGADLTVRFQWNSKKASHYLWLWKKRGLVEPLGGHSDVFANLLVQAQPHWEAALLLARPSALLFGVECLRRAGWTTQIPSRPEVAIDMALPNITTARFAVEARTGAWFQQVAPGVTREKAIVSPLERSLPALRPAWALADMLARKGWGASGLHPSDIDWDEASERDRRDWRAAVSRLQIGAHPGLLEVDAALSTGAD
jgi:hypothetical protein